MASNESRDARRDLRVAAAIFLVLAVLYAGFTQARFQGSDEVGVFQVTESLYERGSLEVPIHRHAHVGADNRLYAAFALGQSILALPFYAAAKLAAAWLPESVATALAGPRLEAVRALRPERLEALAPALPARGKPTERARYGGTLETFFVGLYGPCASALLAAAIFLFLRAAAVTRPTALSTTLLIAVCSYPAMMSTYFLRHTTETLSIVLALLFFRRFRESGAARELGAGSAFASLTFLVRFPAVLAGPALFAYLAAAATQRWRRGDRLGWRHAVAVAGPFAVACAAHMALNYRKWGTLIGSPMVTGAVESSTSFAAALGAFLLSPGIGVFAYSPLLLLLPWTLRAAWQPWRAECVAFSVLAMTQLLFFSNYKYWTGLWSAPGPRYLFPACVLLLLTLAPWLDGPRSFRARVICSSLAVLGACVQLGLLVAGWTAVIAQERYTDYVPQFSFLALPFESPIVASWQAIAAGRIGTWFWKLGKGWGAIQEPLPVIAAGLFVGWLVISVLGILWLRRLAAEPR